MLRLNNLVVVVLFAFVVGFGIVSCKSDIFGGGEEKKTRDVVEIMYERVLPDLCPHGCLSIGDPAGNVYNYDHGGYSIHSWQKVAENKWMGVVDLPYSNSPNMVYVMDPGVVAEYAYTGRKFFVRIRGQDQWVELTRVTPHFDGRGEQAEFILKADGIHTAF